MAKQNKILPRPAKILATLTLTNNEYLNLTTFFPEFSDNLQNGIFFKNLDSVQNITIKKSSVENTQNELSIIPNDEIFIQTADISDILIKISSSSGDQQVSIIAN
jgi:hypothetical protein